MIDSEPAFHQLIKTVLKPLLSGKTDSAPQYSFDLNIQLSSAYRGKDGIGMIKSSITEEAPYSIVLVSARQAEELTGIEIITELWKADPKIQTILCTSYEHYSLENIQNQLGQTDRFFLLKKPIESIELFHLILTLAKKWSLTQKNEQDHSTGELLKISLLTHELQTSISEIHQSIESLLTSSLTYIQKDHALSIARQAEAIISRMNLE